MTARPDRVARAEERARRAGFALSCEPVAGSLLAALAAAVPEGGRILELGTGAGVGLAWILHGLGRRSDARVVSVELDPAMQALAAEASLPAWVRLVRGDGAEQVEQLGHFDLIFADAPGGKLTNLEGTIAALRPRGVLLVDDMDRAQHDDPALVRALDGVRDTLVGHRDLVATELAAGSGLLMAVRRR